MIEQGDKFSTLLISAGVTTFGITYLASRGNHSRLHSEIAKFAMVVETANVLVGLGLRLTQDNSSASKALKRVGEVGLGVIAGCFITVPATDRRVHEHFKSGNSLRGLGGILHSDFKRHMSFGVRDALRL